MKYLGVRCRDCVRYQPKPRAEMPPSTLVLGDYPCCTYSGAKIGARASKVRVIDCDFFIAKGRRSVGRPAKGR